MPGPRPPFGPFQQALAASMLLHLGALAVAVRMDFNGPKAEPDAHSFSVTFPSESPASVPIPEAKAPPRDITSTRVDEGSLPDEPSPPSPVPGAEDVIATPGPAPGDSGGQEAPEQPGGLSRRAIDQSLADYMKNYSSDLGRQWVESCQRYKNRHGTRDCPREEASAYAPHPEEHRIAAELFSALTRPTTNASRAGTMLRELEDLRTLPADNPIVEALVRTRYYLEADKYKHLTGVSNDAWSAFEQGTRANTSDALDGEGTLSLFGTGISLLGNIIHGLPGDDSLNAYGKGTDVIMTDYTLDSRDSAEEEAESDTFEVRPPLLPAN